MQYQDAEYRTWWNRGYQDGVEGCHFIKQPESWTLSQWAVYEDGLKTAQNDMRSDEDKKWGN